MAAAGLLIDYVITVAVPAASRTAAAWAGSEPPAIAGRWRQNMSLPCKPKTRRKPNYRSCPFSAHIAEHEVARSRSS